MALKQDITTDSGLEVNGAYMRIGTIEMNKKGGKFTIETYVSRKLYGEGKTPVKVQAYGFTPDLTKQENIYVQIYKLIKALPEFDGAVDVFEEGQLTQ